jgi:hypothetical protein
LVAPLEPTSVLQSPTPPGQPAPTPPVQPTVQALTVTAAPTGAAPAAKATVKASSDATSDGVGISAVLIWSAVGVGAMFFLGASWRFTRRRHTIETDERYLDGLSRLSNLDDMASK